MNSINFYSGTKFPMYREALAKMQDMINLVANLAGLGGKNFILSGCTTNQDGTITDGLVIINGELLSFTGGVLKTKITVKETRQSVTAFDVVYPETYITRIAQFSDTGEYAWADFSQVKTNTELYKMIRDITGDAPGTIKEWAGAPSKVPTDYMLCDGRDLAITDYPDLYEAIGITFGGDGLTSFKIPNTTGKFSVGYGGDGDYSLIGKTGGEEKHTLIVDEIPAHDHVNGAIYNKLSARAADAASPGTAGAVDSRSPETEYNIAYMNPSEWADATIKSVGGGKSHENRPPYIVFAEIIKVR